MDLLSDITGQLRMLVQILFAMFLAGLVGFEREAKDKPAGIRTHILIGGSAALFAVLGKTVTQMMLNQFEGNAISADPIRILQAIMVGVSFLGAGVILRPKNEDHVVGLTTAASVLLVAGIGVTVASDQYVLATGVTLLALIVLHALHFLERAIGKEER